MSFTWPLAPTATADPQTRPAGCGQRDSTAFQAHMVGKNLTETAPDQHFGNSGALAESPPATPSDAALGAPGVDSPIPPFTLTRLAL